MVERMLAMQPTQEGAAAYEFEREQMWGNLVELVARVDAWLSARGHLRDREGRVLLTLDEWVRAAQREMSDGA